MELIIDSQIMKIEMIEPLLNEANELVKIFVTSRQTAKQNKK